MSTRGRPLDLAAIEAEPIGAALDEIAAMWGVPRERVTRVPAVAAFLELYLAAQVAADLMRAGRPKGLALEFAAAECGISTETLRSRVKRARAAAYGTGEVGPRRTYSPPGRPPSFR